MEGVINIRTKEKSLQMFSLYITAFFAYASFSILFPVIPLFAQEIGASKFEIGLVVAAISYVAAFFMIPFGAISDRVGRKIFIFLGLILFTLAPIFYTIVVSTFELALIRILHGIALAIFIPVANALVVDIAEPDKVGESLGWLSAFTMLGFVLGPTLGGFLTDSYGFNASFYACSILPFFGLVFVFICLRECEDQTIKAGETYYGWLRNFIVIGALLSPLFATWGSSTISSFVPLYAKEFGIATTSIGIMITALYLGSALFRIPSGMISDRIGRRPVIISGLTTCAVAVFLVPLFTTFYTLSAVTILFGLGMGLTVPAGFALLADAIPARSRGLAMGFANSFLQAGLALGATSMGFVLEGHGFTLMFQSCALIILFGITFVYFLTSKAR